MVKILFVGVYYKVLYNFYCLQYQGTTWATVMINLSNLKIVVKTKRLVVLAFVSG